MKWINFILSIYVVILSCMPCTDTNKLIGTESNVVTSLVENKDNHTHSKEDNCPPFCECNCARSQVLNHPFILSFDLTNHISEPTAKKFFYKSNLSSNFYGNIWQPPQIV